MKKLFFLGFGLCHLANTQAFWPFTSSSKQTSVNQASALSYDERNTIAQEFNKLINEIEELKQKRIMLEADIIANLLHHNNEIIEKDKIIEQKNQEITQLKKQVTYFSTAYIMLCKAYKKYSSDFIIKDAFNILKNSLLQLDNDPEITTDIEAATKNFNEIIKEDLRLRRQGEIKKNLTTILTKESTRS